MIGNFNKFFTAFLLVIFLLITVSSLLSQETDNEGNILLKDEKGNLLVKTSPDFVYEVSEEGSLIFTNKNKEGLGFLDYKGYHLNGEENSKWEFNFKEDGSTDLTLIGNGEVTFKENSYKNIQNAFFKLDNNNEISYAEFTSTIKDSYSFNYNGETYLFNSENSSKILFDPLNNKISLMGASMNFQDYFFESNDKVEFKLDKNGTIQEAFFQKGGSLQQSGLTKLSFNGETIFRSPLGRCSDSNTNCIQFLNRKRIKNGVEVITKDADIYLSGENGFVFSSKDGLYDDINIVVNKDSNAIISLMNENSDKSNILISGKEPFKTSNYIDVGTDFHITYNNLEEETHTYHLVDGKSIKCSDCETLGYSKKIIPGNFPKIYVYSGGDKGSRENLLSWFKSSDVDYSVTNARASSGGLLKEEKDTKIRLISGHHYSADRGEDSFKWFSEFESRSLDIRDLPISESDKIVFYMGCNGIKDPSKIEDYSGYIRTILKSAPNAVHLGFSTHAPSSALNQGPGSPAIIKDFLKNIENPENIFASSSEEIAEIWIKSNSVIEGRATIAAYYKDSQGEWYWTNGLKKVKLPKKYTP
jgi:hypothetical protein